MTRSALGHASLAFAMLGVVACGSNSAPPVPTVVVVTPDTARLLQGSTLQLVASVHDAEGDAIPGKTVIWSGGGSAVTIDATGLLTSLSAGQGTVTATFGTLTTDVPVLVTGHPGGVLGPRLTLGSRPFGIAIGVDSVMLVTQLDSAATAKGRTDLASFSGAIAVGGTPTDVTLSADGLNGYVTNQGSGTVGMLAVAAGMQGSEVTVPGNPFRVRRGTAGIVYVTTNADSVFAVNTTSNTVVGRAPAGTGPNGLALSADGSRLYVSNSLFGTVTEVSIATMEVLRTITVGQKPQDIVLSPDGTELYMADENGPMRVLTLSTGAVVDGPAGTFGMFGLALSPDGALLYGTQPAAGGVLVINRAAHAVVTSILVGGTPRRVAFDVLGTMAAVSNEFGWVDLIH